MRAIPIPQRLITLWWQQFRFPSLEKVVGECDIYQVSEICMQPAEKARTVAMIHDLTALLFPEQHKWANVFVNRHRLKGIKKYADAVLTNSEVTKRDIVEHLQIDPVLVHVTHLGADERFRPMDELVVEPILQKYGIGRSGDGQPYILFVGTLEPRKNIPSLVEAFNLLKSRHGIPHQLVLVGGKGWLTHDIFASIHASPYEPQIIRVGYAADEDLPALYNGADLFAYPSFYEGFGLPVLEAMKCGAPVVTSNTSSMPEVGGEATLYADPYDLEDLVNKIYSVINNTELRQNLSYKGLVRAREFNWQKCAHETLAVYRKLQNQ